MVDVVAEVTAEHAVTGPWGHIGVRFPFLVAEDHVARTFDVERAVRALDNTTFTAEELEAIDKASGYSKE